jgi:hypothetical protein
MARRGSAIDVYSEAFLLAQKKSADYVSEDEPIKHLFESFIMSREDTEHGIRMAVNFGMIERKLIGSEARVYPKK